jgi:hypothetical protein
VSCPRLAEEGHGSWFFSLDLPRTISGRRCRVRRGGYPTRQAAEQALEQLSLPDGRVLTVADWLVTWLETGPGCGITPAAATPPTSTAT